MPYDPYRALYVHIPFCVKRCGYCDFTTHAVARDASVIDEYVERVVMDLRRAAKEGKLAELETAYLGGGTPSFIGASRLSSLLYAVSVSADLTKEGFEFTMEANPESLDERLVKDIWALGVNRLSIGVQSFDDDVLKLLGRAHDAEGARRAIETAQTRFDNVSVDLMCGIPGQPIESFERSVNEAVSLGVSHVSVYPLSIEPHTPFDQLVLAGQMDETDDDEQAAHMERAAQILEKAGYRRYEVASYARPGFECRHNIAYWTGVPYLGIGEGATTMTQNDERRMRMTDGVVTDDLNRPQMEAEDLMLGMRLADGVSDDRVEQASQYLSNVHSTLDELQGEGYLQHDDGRWRPTNQGWLCGNDVFERLLTLE